MALCSLLGQEKPGKSTTQWNPFCQRARSLLLSNGDFWDVLGCPMSLVKFLFPAEKSIEAKELLVSTLSPPPATPCSLTYLLI